jgi:outer membrane protein assembly factor BamB
MMMNHTPATRPFAPRSILAAALLALAASASPVAANGRLYFVGDEGQTTVLEAGPKFNVLARNPLGEKVQASPAIADGRFYIRTAGSLFCIGK